jgi:signal-transduction protein with cAMP-binding, CBS, and nucleotidyltransferase domain
MASYSEFDEAYDDPVRQPKVLTEDILGEPISNLEPHIAVSFHVDATVDDAVLAMNQKSIGCVLVTDGDALIGIFTERDVMRRIVGRGYNLAKLRLGDYMTPNPETLSPNDPIAFALNRMSVGGYRHVPLVDDAGGPIRIISIIDVVRFLVEHFPKSVLNLPPQPRQRISDIPHGAG